MGLRRPKPQFSHKLVLWHRLGSGVKIPPVDGDEVWKFVLGEKDFFFLPLKISMEWEGKLIM